MQLLNNTKNQHFVSQVEQRLNALNPMASEVNQRIYSFTLEDRENYLVALDDDKGKSIQNNLLLYDLFSFDVINRKSTRMNFELLFEQYETDIKQNTKSLIVKLISGSSDIKAEILNIFVPKVLNFLRNPYSVKKILNSVGQIGRYKPTDPEILQTYGAIISGKRPQQVHLCSELGISDTEYKNWLLALFLLLVRFEDGKTNILESVVKGLYENPSNHIMVFVYQYLDEFDDKRCLLSDRGYSMPLPEGPHLSFDFNLCANAFIRYVFTDVNEAAPAGTDQRTLAAFKQMRRTVNMYYIKNDLNALAIYNRHVIYQCHNKVYSSSKIIYGL
jgi:hypothetical protein